MTIDSINVKTDLPSLKVVGSDKLDFLIEKIKKYEKYSRIANYVGWTSVVVVSAAAVASVIVFSIPALPAIFGAIMCVCIIFAPPWIAGSGGFSHFVGELFKAPAHLAKVIYPTVAINTVFIAGGIICGVGIVAASAFLLKDYFDDKVSTLNEELNRLQSEKGENSN